ESGVQDDVPVLPLISVVAVVDGELSHAKRCLDSIQRQSYPNFEVIVVSNSGNPVLNEKLGELVFELPRIRIIYEVSNNRARLWNRGIDEATGEYIAMIRSGYEWDIEHLEKMTQYAQRNRANLVFSQVRL